MVCTTIAVVTTTCAGDMQNIDPKAATNPNAVYGREWKGKPAELRELLIRPPRIGATCWRSQCLRDLLASVCLVVN